MRVEQRVDGDDGRGGACGAAAETARQGKALADCQRDAVADAESVEQCLGGNAGGVARRVARHTSAVASDVVDPHDATGPRQQSRSDFVPGRVEREPEHVEAARNVRHRRGRERGHARHGNTEHDSTLAFRG